MNTKRGETPRFFILKFRLAGHIRAAGDFRLYRTSSNFSIGKINKIIIQENPEFVYYYPLTSGTICGIIIVSRGKGNNRENKPPSLEKKCKIPLDKSRTMWYYNSVKRREKQTSPRLVT